MIIVQGWARLPDKAIDALEEAVLAMVGATRAEVGCIDYAMARDISDPHLIRISEVWESDGALMAHFTTPHMAAFNAAIGNAAPEALSIWRYDIAGEAQPLVVRG